MEIAIVGGFGEVGKNMVAVKVENEVVLLDMGIYLPAIINLEDEERINLSEKRLIEIGAIPNDVFIEEWQPYVKAIVLGHCHLDHIAAIPFSAAKYNAPIIATPYTLEVLKATLHDDEIKIVNSFRQLNVNSTLKLSDTLKIEFINITHSTPQSTLVAVYTKEGIILYANDFKFDNNPIIGKKPNYKKLKQLGSRVKVLILESLYADREGKTPSEKVAQELLNDVLLGVSHKGHIVFVTTFASHIARLKSIISLGRRMKRKIIIFGRSMAKYIGAAEKLGLVKFSKHAKIVAYKKQIKKELEKIEKDRGSYLVVCTGSQGEPNSVLDRITKNDVKFGFIPEDSVIFSCRTIPVEINEANRAALEMKLKQKKVRIFKDVHVSGHSSREDLRDFINIVKPEHIIPAHGDLFKMNSLAELATEMGYKLKKNLHVLTDGQKLKL
ncbi:MAG: RNase J family beta-CASP ribonuclease [Nanoarchaeota archaeon]